MTRPPFASRAARWGRHLWRAFARADRVVPALALVLAAEPLAADARVPHASGHARKKAQSVVLDTPAIGPPAPLLATLVQTHTDERVPLEIASPLAARFDALLADRVTGSRAHVDPRLLDLLRAVAASHPGCRVDLVSGFRSPKLNEMLRKKGHHVASHSQHSLGHAVDFRIVDPGAERGIDPRALEGEIRALGWDGGVGVYPTQGDWFVHADVGPRRRWVSD